MVRIKQFMAFQSKKLVRQAKRAKHETDQAHDEWIDDFIILLCGEFFFLEFDQFY